MSAYTESLFLVQGNNIWNRVEQYKPIYVEPRHKAEFQTAMTNYYERVQDPSGNGAVFAAVCRGKVKNHISLELSLKFSAKGN